MKRPTVNDPRINEIAVERLLPEVIQWVDTYGSKRKTEARIKKDLITAISSESDGYVIAKKMDEYKPDANLVFILNHAYMLKQKALKELEGSWVACNNIKPPALRTRVTHPSLNGAVGFVDRNLDHGYSSVLIGDATSSGIAHLKWEELTITP